IAINAVLAGCDPEYLPLLLAAVEGMAAPEFNLQAIQATTNPVAVWVIVNMNTHSKDADELLRIIAETLVHPPSNEYCHGGEPWIMLAPEHADILKGAGLTKRDVKRALWERSRMPARHMSARDLLRTRESRRAELGEIGPNTLLPIAKRPDDIGIIVAGGAGTHSVYIPCFGNSRAVTREVQESKLKRQGDT
ncbi:MAG: hypothetical protein HY322_11705, partial [Betaproteobacteria bacterium]|nr:hypothetical protein [Betaproteobacteria bacterium]